MVKRALLVSVGIVLLAGAAFLVRHDRPAHTLASAPSPSSDSPSDEANTGMPIDTGGVRRPSTSAAPPRFVDPPPSSLPVERAPPPVRLTAEQFEELKKQMQTRREDPELKVEGILKQLETTHDPVERHKLVADFTRITTGLAAVRGALFRERLSQLLNEQELALATAHSAAVNASGTALPR